MRSRLMMLICMMFSVTSFAIHANAQGNDTTHQAVQKSWLNPSGMTVESRFLPPEGYVRKTYDDPYTDYMRKLPMLPDGSPVLIYTGEIREYQDTQVGVLNIDVGKRDLQQCSDAAQRLRAEYLYQTGQHEKIHYHFSNGMALPWDKWRAGWRVKKEKNKTWLVKTSSSDNSYQNFRKYLDMLFMYAGVNSVMKESKVLDIADVRPGDALAAVGHLIIILDVVENAEGKKKLLLAQSYIPAQQIEVLKNPYSHNPWYDAESVQKCPFITPGWEYDCPGAKFYRLL